MGGGYISQQDFGPIKGTCQSLLRTNLDMATAPTEDGELGDILMQKTKHIAMGITCSKSKNRALLFNKIRTEVRKLAAV